MALQFIEYFEQKLHLFGEDKLVAPVTIFDLQSMDLENLTQMMTKLEQRDQSNQCVLFYNMDQFDIQRWTTESFVSILYLMVWFCGMCFWIFVKNKKREKKEVCVALGNM